MLVLVLLMLTMALMITMLPKGVFCSAEKRAHVSKQPLGRCPEDNSTTTKKNNTDRSSGVSHRVLMLPLQRCALVLQHLHSQVRVLEA